MPLLKNEFMTFSLNDKGEVCSIVNGYNGHEYCVKPGETFKLIYKEGDREERPVFGALQTPVITVDGNKMKVAYNTLKSDDRELDIKLVFDYTLEKNELSVTASIENNSDVTVVELQTTSFSGLRSLNGNPEKDYIMWSERQGIKVDNPAFADLSQSAGFRKYERHDFLHSDLDVLYPGRSCMQCYVFCNDDEGIYVGSHDDTHQIICQHVERTIADNTLRLGIIKYPFVEPGEKYEARPIVYATLDGDWHKGVKIYRKWSESCGWKAPVQPKWAKEFQGWLRCIFKTHHGEYNWTYKDIPRLFDQAQAAGLNTIFVLGWSRGGFAKMWPDYVVDDRQGGAEELKKAIDYVHSKGGKLVMFLSYYLIDRKSEFYKNGGDKCCVKDVWGFEYPFAETYCGEATYRKLPNQPMPMFAACSGSDEWHEKMKKSADYCLDLGCDGVLYDLGGLKPILCFAEGHDHDKPNFSHASKARRYAELRNNVKKFGDDKVIMQEHCVDIFAQSMDIIQPGGFNARNNTRTEFFRYTFPEIVMTNREMGQDENNFVDNVNFTFIYGIAFDMTIYRCCGDLNDIPNYAKYMHKAIDLRKKYSDYFYDGTFVDTDGFATDKDVYRHKGYVTKDGRLGVAVWNWSDGDQCVVYTNTKTGKSVEVKLAKDEIDFIEL